MATAQQKAEQAFDRVVEWLEHFEELEDPRQQGKVWYPLDEMLLLYLLAVLAGADSWVEVAAFGKAKPDLLRRFAPFEKGTPSHDQLGDLFAVLDAEQFQACFVARVGSLTRLAPDVVAIDGKRLYLRGYNVFNANQVDGYTPAAAPEPLPPVERIAIAEAYFAATGATFVYGGERAFYRPATDTIQMPDDTLWTGTATMTAAESHAAVKAHELVHWSGHPSRCDRQLANRFGDKAYCAEELVAEIGSCLLAAKLGITADVRPDHAQYLALYLELMKADSKAIFTAAAAAQRAIEFLDGLQPSAPAPDRPPDALGAFANFSI
jgi:hypothetical protein